MTAGFSIASGALSVGGGVKTVVEYTTKVLDSKKETSEGDSYPLSPEILALLTRRIPAGSDLARAGLRKYQPAPGEPPLIGLDAEMFVVVEKKDLRLREDITKPVSKGLAQLALADYLDKHPAGRETLQVIALADVREAA
jgi:hypothetical protein